MTPKPDKETITIHILPNVSPGKKNQTMKFGQLIEYNYRNIFSSKIIQKMRQEAGPLVPGHFLFFEKALYEVKSRGLQLSL